MRLCSQYVHWAYHFDNDLIIETEFRNIIQHYNDYNGTGVYGKSFRFYVKNDYDPVPSAIKRILPGGAKVQIKNETVTEEDDDPIETYR